MVVFCELIGAVLVIEANGNEYGFVGGSESGEAGGEPAEEVLDGALRWEFVGGV